MAFLLPLLFRGVVLYFFFAVTQISERRCNTYRVDCEGTGKRELRIYGVDKSCCQGTCNTSQRLSRIEKSHHEVFLFRCRLICYHVLESRDADGVTCVYEDTEQDKDPDIHRDQSSDGRQRAECCEDYHGFFYIRPLNDPDTEAHIGDKGDETDTSLNDSVVR